MRFNTHSSALRASAASVFAVAVISLLAWSFDSYSDHLWRTRGAAAVIEAGSTGDRTTLDA